LLLLVMTAFAAGCSDDQAKTVTPPGNTRADTHPPMAPVMDEWTAPEGGPLHLTWVESTEPDVVGYNVYRYEPSPERTSSYTLLNSPPLTTNEFVVEDAVPGVYEFYRVSCVDEVGNESALSGYVETSFHYPSNDQPPLIENRWEP
jgi:hypothetical protein